MSETPSRHLSPQSESIGIARAAAVIALGNITGRVLGLARETVKSDLFGAAWGVDAFQVASVVPIQLYELLVGGMVTGGLVPVFSDYAEPEQRAELWTLFSSLASLLGLLLAGLLAAAELAAPLIAWLLGRGFESEARQLAAAMLRITLPAVFFLCMSGLLSGLLYALKRFHLPAFTSSVFNASIVAAALVLGPRLDVTSMAIGVLAGSILQVALQLPGLHGLRPRWRIDWQHPGVRKLIRLYGPVAASLVISQLVIYLSYSLASLTGEGSIAWMNYATTLIQFPQGLVAMAISTAILPTLSRQASNCAGAAQAGGALPGEFMATLAQGLKMVLLLIIPATFGLFVLARPIIDLLFEHGQFSAGDTLATVQVLRLYLLGLTFAAVDLPLVYAFYARKDTLTPALAGLLCMVIYLLAALLPGLFRPLRVTDLALANSIQLTSHAALMLALLARHAGHPLRGYGLLRLAGKALASSILMSLGVLGMVHLIEPSLEGAGLLGELIVVASAGAAGAGAYVGLMALFKAEELAWLWQLIQRQRPTA